MAFDKPGRPDEPARKTDASPSAYRIEEEGKRYWSGSGTSNGKTAGIPWGTPGDFDECRTRLTPHLGAGAAGYCERMHERATGFPPGKAPGERG